MNYLSTTPSKQAVYSTNHKNKDKNSLLMINLKNKICNNTEYEYEHKFTNDIINGNLKKSCSVNEYNNLIKINNINPFYRKNNSQNLDGKVIKLENVDKSINHKNISDVSENNKNKKIGENSNNNSCYLF